MKRRWGELFVDEKAASAIEYALVTTLIAIAMLTGLVALGAEIRNSYTSTANKVTEASNQH